MVDDKRDLILILGSLANFITIWDNIYQTLIDYQDVANQLEAGGIDLDKFNQQMQKLGNKVEKVIYA